MTTCAEIITRALRKTGALAVSEMAEGAQLDEGLVSLQGLYEAWAADGALGSLTDVLVDADCEAGEWQRITSAETVSVTLPASIQDGPVVRPVRDGAMVVLALGAPHQVWRYEAQTAGWISLSDLGLEDEAPLARLSPDGLAACVAAALGGEAGGVSGLVAGQAEAFRAMIARSAVRAGVDATVRGDLWRMTRRGP